MKAMKVINLMNVRGFLLMISENSTELKQQTREKQRCLYPDKSTITSFCIYFLIFLPHYERLILYTAVINRIYADGSLFDSETSLETLSKHPCLASLSQNMGTG